MLPSTISTLTIEQVTKLLNTMPESARGSVAHNALVERRDALARAKRANAPQPSHFDDTCGCTDPYCQA